MNSSLQNIVSAEDIPYAFDLMHVLSFYPEGLSWNELWCKSRSDLDQKRLWKILGRFYTANFIHACTKYSLGKPTLGVRLNSEGWKYVRCQN